MAFTGSDDIDYRSSKTLLPAFMLRAPIITGPIMVRFREYYDTKYREKLTESPTRQTRYVTDQLPL